MVGQDKELRVGKGTRDRCMFGEAAGGRGTKPGGHTEGEDRHLWGQRECRWTAGAELCGWSPWLPVRRVPTVPCLERGVFVTHQKMVLSLQMFQGDEADGG